MITPADKDDDPFLITSELEIRSILRSIQRSKSLVRMYARGNPEQSIMTTILDLDDSLGRVIVDISPDEELNNRLTRAQSTIFDTQVDHVNIHFSGDNLERRSEERRVGKE